jgi:hypothetical protein
VNVLPHQVTTLKQWAKWAASITDAYRIKKNGLGKRRIKVGANIDHDHLDADCYLRFLASLPKVKLEACALLLWHG